MVGGTTTSLRIRFEGLGGSVGLVLFLTKPWVASSVVWRRSPLTTHPWVYRSRRGGRLESLGPPCERAARQAGSLGSFDVRSGTEVCKGEDNSSRGLLVFVFANSSGVAGREV